MKNICVVLNFGPGDTVFFLLDNFFRNFLIHMVFLPPPFLKTQLGYFLKVICVIFSPNNVEMSEM